MRAESAGAADKKDFDNEVDPIGWTEIGVT